MNRFFMLCSCLGLLAPPVSAQSFAIHTLLSADSRGQLFLRSAASLRFPLGVFAGSMQSSLSDNSPKNVRASLVLDPARWLLIAGGHLSMRGSLSRLFHPSPSQSLAVLSSKRVSEAQSLIRGAGGTSSGLPFGASFVLSPSFYAGAEFTPAAVFYGDVQGLFAGNIGFGYRLFSGRKKRNSLRGSVSVSLASYLMERKAGSQWFLSASQAPPFYFPEARFYSASFEGSLIHRYGGFFGGGGLSQSPLGPPSGWLRGEAFIDAGGVHVFSAVFWAPRRFLAAGGTGVRKSLTVLLSLRLSYPLAVVQGKWVLGAGAVADWAVQSGSFSLGGELNLKWFSVRLVCGLHNWGFVKMLENARLPIELGWIFIFGAYRLRLNPSVILYFREGSYAGHETYSTELRASMSERVSVGLLKPELFMRASVMRSDIGGLKYSFRIGGSWQIKTRSVTCVFKIQYTNHGNGDNGR